MKMPRPLADRDFVQCTTTKETSEDTTVILYRNTTDHRYPEGRSIVRCVQIVK